MSHTPEPWSVGETHLDDADYPETVIRGLDGRAAIGVTLDFGQNNPDMRQENARRIVACINACTGLSIDELERFGLGSAIGTEIHGLKVERDTYRELCGDLLKVLADAQNTLAHCKADVGYVNRQTDTAIKLNTAITKAESILGEKNGTSN